MLRVEPASDAWSCIYAYVAFAAPWFRAASHMLQDQKATRCTRLTRLCLEGVYRLVSRLAGYKDCEKHCTRVVHTDSCCSMHGRTFTYRNSIQLERLQEANASNKETRMTQEEQAMLLRFTSGMDSRDVCREVASGCLVPGVWEEHKWRSTVGALWCALPTYR